MSQFDTPLGVLLAFFQEDRYFWCVGLPDLQAVECRFCGARAERPGNVRHNQFCVIQLAVNMIMSDEALLARVRSSPPRHVFRGTATLTVYRGGDRRFPV